MSMPILPETILSVHRSEKLYATLMEIFNWLKALSQIIEEALPRKLDILKNKRTRGTGKIWTRSD